MRKQDIKPGVIYAYQRGRSDYDKPLPVVFLNAPADGVLYCEASPHRAPGKPAFTPAYTGAKPHRVSFGSDVGYPAVRFRWDDRDSDPASLLGVTLEDFEASTGGASQGREFIVVTSLTAIVGPLDEAVAAYEARKRADADRRDRERQEADAGRARAIDIITALFARDIRADRIPTYGAVTSVSLPLAEAEKLIALLRESGS